MTAPIYLFVLVATAVGTSEVGGPPGSQTVGYYATAGECQADLLRLLKTAKESRVRLDCQPLKVTP
jgi:hypothetical protein